MKKTTSSKHNIWHHIGMVLYQEVVNILWLVVAVVVLIAGLAVFIFSTTAFFKIAIGIPVFLIGASLGLIKIHEIIAVIVKPKEIATICRFCNAQDDG